MSVPARPKLYHIAHVELAGDHVGDQAGAVFAEEGDLAFGLAHRLLHGCRLSDEMRDDRVALLRWWYWQSYVVEVVGVEPPKPFDDTLCPDSQFVSEYRRAKNSLEVFNGC